MIPVLALHLADAVQGTVGDQEVALLIEGDMGWQSQLSQRGDGSIPGKGSSSGDRDHLQVGQCIDRNRFHEQGRLVVSSPVEHGHGQTSAGKRRRDEGDGAAVFDLGINPRSAHDHHRIGSEIPASDGDPAPAQVVDSTRQNAEDRGTGKLNLLR